MVSSRVPAALRARLGDDATFGLIEVLDSDRKEWSEHVLSVAANRFERRLTEEISVLRVEVRDALHDGLSSVRQEMATTRVEMLKWSFLFWLGQVAAMAGLLAFMLRHP
jgi:regulation of enolase protein 1 (concanavalin A-like superfamily)